LSTQSCFRNSNSVDYCSYQESGRSGRDGDRADCILFYSYKDKKVLENMIRKSATDPNGASTRRKIDQLYTCVRYCEDEFRCRRTMQLEFFGENFDRNKCNKTCDNCKSGKEPDRRDMTDVAKTIMGLLTEISSQKNGRGVTMVQLSELYRGSKSQSATKFLNTSRLKAYGAGSKFKRFDIDRITHAMVFERLLVETSVENGGGFSSDYVSAGENSSALLHTGKRFSVEFPMHRASRKPDNSKSTNEKNTTSSKSKTKRKTPPKASAATRTMEVDSGLQFLENGDDSEAELMADSSFSRSATKPDSPQTLPFLQTKKLVALMKTLTQIWAQEEQLLGNNVFCKFCLRALRFCVVAPRYC
jgi:bloom syndrome protein